MDLRPGSTIFGSSTNDRYEITRFIANGAFGLVYEVRTAAGQRLALKTITTGYLDGTELDALGNEGRLAVQIQDPNVLRVFYFHDGKTYPELPPYMLMECADGGTLADLLKQQRSASRQFEPTELYAMFVQLAKGMRAVNAKLVHRDIKPDNILLNNSLWKIADFGLSKIVGAYTRQMSFKGIGHCAYYAPEAWMGQKNSPAMDMYSMGIVFYELATLKFPYKVQQDLDSLDAWKSAHLSQIPDDPRKHNSSLNLTCAQLIMKMISKRPDERYSTWEEVIDRLESKTGQTQLSPDVRPLVEHMLEKRRMETTRRLEHELKERLRAEELSRISYAFKKEVAGSAQSVIDAFNAASEYDKLYLKQSGDMHFTIGLQGRTDAQHIQCHISRLGSDDKMIDGRKIIAWGMVKAPTGRGFNILLVTSSSDDLYGKWKTLHVTHSPLARNRDGRPEPFPFELDELDREILLLRGLHVYQSEIGELSPEMFKQVIKEIL